MGKEPEIFTFGCRLNSYESEIIEQNLIEKGLRILLFIIVVPLPKKLSDR